MHRKATRIKPTKLLILVLAPLVAGLAQTSGPGLSTSGAVVRVQVRPYADKPREGLSRKRFYLLKGSLKVNSVLIERLSSRPAASRDCFYINAGASPQFIAWLKEHDCESVYCREIGDKYLQGEAAVPEFRDAFASGLQEYGSAEIAKKWLTTNLPENLRYGFYLSQKKSLAEILKDAEKASGASVLSVMTDRNGSAYFTNVPAGDYTVSSLAAIEVGNNSVVFNCDLEIKTDDLGTEKLVRINKQNKKCVLVEKPLPACQRGTNVSL